MGIREIRNFNSLFICSTPLHCLIASAIINKNKLDKKDCYIFYHTRIDNAKNRDAYENLKRDLGGGVYLISSKFFWMRLWNTIIIIRSIFYKNVYFAIPDSVFTQMALSRYPDIKLSTFDDGTANIYESSRYNKRRGLPLHSLILSYIFGNRYSIERIKRESVEHFTLYDGVPNNMRNECTHITLFSENEYRHSDFSGNCAVILGTVYKEVYGNFSAERVDSLINKIIRKIDKNTPVYYISHPRENYIPHANFNLISSFKVAEISILNLLEKYQSIDIYGFFSSAQINMSGISYINNICILGEVSDAISDELRVKFSRILSGRVKFIEI